MNQNTSRRYFEPTGFWIEKTAYRKIHRIFKNIEFLERCIFHNVIPAFAKIGKFADKSFSSKEIENAQHKTVRTELQNQKINLLNAENSFNQICLNLKSTCRTLYEFENHLNFIKSHVVKNEKFDDNKRYKKLDRLVSEAKRDYNRVKFTILRP